MKRFLSMLLAVLLACGACTVALAEVDLSDIRENDNLFTIDVDVENDVAYIEGKLAVKERAFTHKYESSTRYSNTKFDVLIVDYLGTDAYPVLRLWTTYCSDDDYMNITSASFIIGDKKYTFSGIGNKEWYLKDDDGYVEQVLIRFGVENLEFLAAMESLFGDKDLEKALDEIGDLDTRLILHGREDIEVELGTGFFVDFALMRMGWLTMNGLDYIEEVNSTTMKVEDVE